MKKYFGLLLGLLILFTAIPSMAETLVDNGNYAYIRIKNSKECQDNYGQMLSAEVDSWVKAKKEALQILTKQTLRSKILKIESAVPQIEIVCQSRSSGTFVSAVVGMHIFYSKE